MKLKRIISALVVFTLVMTCAVCTVSADATHKVTTVYQVGSTDVTVNASVSGLTEGDLVSYIIYQPVEGVDGVAVDGSNIVHIDQATVSDGTATFEAFTAPYDAVAGDDYLGVNGGKVKFVAKTATSISAWSEGKLVVTGGTTYVDSVSEFTDWQKNAVICNLSSSAKPTHYYYVTEDGDIEPAGEVGTNITSINAWAGDSERYPSAKVLMPLDAVAYIADFGTRDYTARPRDAYHMIYYTRLIGSYNGVASTSLVGDTLYDSSGETENFVINGRYKEDITDGDFAGIPLEGGVMLALTDSNVPFDMADEQKPVSGNTSTEEDVYDGYIAVDAQPIFSDYEKNENSSYPSVTFLATASDVAMEQEIGLAVYRYPKGTFGANKVDEKNGTIIEGAMDEVAEGELLGYYKAAHITDDGKFAIQLFDGLEANEWINEDEYDYDAVPFVVVDGEAVELTVFGENEVNGTYYFYSVDRETVNTEGTIVE